MAAILQRVVSRSKTWYRGKKTQTKEKINKKTGGKRHLKGRRFSRTELAIE